MKQLRNDELQKQLNEAFPELDVYIMYMSTAKAAAKLSIEGPSSGESGECLYGESRRTYGWCDKCLIRDRLNPVYKELMYVPDLKLSGTD